MFDGGLEVPVDLSLSPIASHRIRNSEPPQTAFDIFPITIQTAWSVLIFYYKFEGGQWHISWVTKIIHQHLTKMIIHDKPRMHRVLASKFSCERMRKFVFCAEFTVASRQGEEGIKKLDLPLVVIFHQLCCCCVQKTEIILTNFINYPFIHWQLPEHHNDFVIILKVEHVNCKMVPRIIQLLLWFQFHSGTQSVLGWVSHPSTN